MHVHAAACTIAFAMVFSIIMLQAAAWRQHIGSEGMFACPVVIIRKVGPRGVYISGIGNSMLGHACRGGVHACACCGRMYSSLTRSGSVRVRVRDQEPLSPALQEDNTPAGPCLCNRWGAVTNLLRKSCWGGVNRVDASLTTRGSCEQMVAGAGSSCRVRVGPAAPSAGQAMLWWSLLVAPDFGCCRRLLGL
eukprot:jgi/Ulvmu1/4950/UM206_0002.1